MEIFSGFLKERVIIKIPELSTIMFMVGAYLYSLPKILDALRDSDLIRFLFVVSLVSAVVGIASVLLVIQHSTRIAQEEVRKSRAALREALSLLRKKGIQIGEGEDKHILRA